MAPWIGLLKIRPINWTPLNPVDPASLRRQRLQLHHAALVVASAAHGVLPHLGDDSHSNLGLDPALGRLGSRPLPGGVSVQLQMVDLSLAVVRGGQVCASTALDGMDVEGALEWLRGALVGLGIDAPIALLRFPDFPGSSPMHGERFSAKGADGRRMLAAAFGNALALMESLGDTEPALSDARVWPHHFDLGALMSLPGDGERSIGLGMSPGDEHFAEPYLYCSPYPAPGADAELPALPVGQWTRDGFTSAILRWSELLSADDQAAAARSYLGAAIAACRA